ncbi:MAG TPA: hypothetical protein VG413_00105 [Candidatus Dormibacteraeota bacterium]|nr:hypothetical protein [Candidatus Dormibacteraeota bacterium]
MTSEIFPTRPFPFENGEFPHDLGAVVMKTVLEGTLPALQVVHTGENRWAIADGINDPNGIDACEVAHIWHVINQDPSLRPLSHLPIGFQADREAPGEPWTVTKANSLD